MTETIQQTTTELSKIAGCTYRIIPKGGEEFHVWAMFDEGTGEHYTQYGYLGTPLPSQLASMLSAARNDYDAFKSNRALPKWATNQ